MFVSEIRGAPKILRVFFFRSLFVEIVSIMGVRVIQIKNPPVNALSKATVAKLLLDLEEANADVAVHSIVLVGLDNGNFSGAFSFSIEMKLDLIHYLRVSWCRYI